MATIVNLALTQKNQSNYNSIYENVPPEVRNVGDAILKGNATISNLARGLIANTGIAFSNSNVFHICEPFGAPATKNVTRYSLNSKGKVVKISQTSLGTPVLKMDILLKSAAMQAIITAIRSAIENALGLASPLIQLIKDVASYIAGILEVVNYIISIYNDIVITIIQVIQYINLILKFIASLPLLIANALSECVRLLAAGLASALTGSLNIDTGGLLTQYQLLKDNLAAAQSYTQQIGDGVNDIITNVSNLGDNLSNNITTAVDTVTNSLSNAQTSFSPPILVKVV
jgi:phage-related protein